MKRDYFGYSKSCAKKDGGFWKVMAAVFFVVALVAAANAVVLKIQNKKYRDKLIEVSENFPNTPEQEAELEEIRRREEWSRAYAPTNRQTVEERMEDNRITEEA